MCNKLGGRGQGFVQHEAERHLAGERRRDDWAVILVSAAAPVLRACFGLVALQWWGVAGWVQGHAWLHAEWAVVGRSLFSTRLSGTLPESVGEMTGLSYL